MMNVWLICQTNLIFGVILEYCPVHWPPEIATGPCNPAKTKWLNCGWMDECNAFLVLFTLKLFKIIIQDKINIIVSV